MLQVSVPLYHSGSDYSKTRAAEQTAVQKRMDLEDVRHKVREQTVKAWQALQTAQAALRADAAEVKANTLALDGVREESKVGTRTTLDVLNAEQELLDAKVDEAKSRHDHDIALLQLRAATGELTPEHLRLAVERYDPKRHYDDVRDQWIGFSADETRYDVRADAAGQ